MRLIDADTLVYSEVDEDWTGTIPSRLAVYKENIDNTPTVDAQPVIHAKWIPRLHASENDIFICSNCHRELGYDPDYCPNCGAKMESEDNT